MLRSPPARVLGAPDLPAVRSLIATDPVANVFVAERVEVAGLDPWRLGAEMWGHEADGRLVGLCYSGANLIPVCAGEDAVRAFAERARRAGRRCSSIVGPASMVRRLWNLLEPAWGPAREVRPQQPLLALDADPRVPGDPAVRRVRPDEIDVLLPASVAMFSEEIGYSPVGVDGGRQYRERVTEMIAAGRCFARIEDGAVLFKADVGAVCAGVCQLQGVWVRPDLRGRGIGSAGTAAVVAEARRSVAPLVSLYVNSFNNPARRAYERVGFTQVGTFASVLF